MCVHKERGRRLRLGCGARYEIIAVKTVATNETADELIEAWKAHGGDPARSVVFSRMFVHEAWTGRGLGRRLFTTALEAVSQRRMVMMVLTKNQDAIRLYEKLGCEKFGETVYRTKLGKEYGAWYYATPDSLGH